MVRGIQYDVTTELPEYLSDESRQIGSADSISFPESADELRDHLRYAAVRHQAVTVQGARTGITAGAVPEGGHILNLSRMKNILSFEENTAPRITVQPGLTLTELRWAIHEETGGKWFFPPDPTEASATVGGMIACNASGARSFCYGAVRKYVTALRVMLIDGSKLFLRRGISRSQGRDFELVTDDGRRVTGQLPTYSLPSVKNASGYFVQDSMDLLDLLVGSEGTLGVVYEAELSLKPSLPVQFSLLAFLPDDNTAVQIVNRLRRRKAAGHGGLIALEFFDEKALNLIREQPAAGEFGLPSTSGPALYFEYHGDGNNF
ncbi:MAG TPA: FAD-binding oxidoreductase, partial [Acidobacteriota bacterium]|nr:FAD-binding oxidoreductase [Acidobacteriota bacterium]